MRTTPSSKFRRRIEWTDRNDGNGQETVRFIRPFPPSSHFEFESNLTVSPARFLETREVDQWLGRRVAATFEPALSFTSFHSQTEFDEFQPAMPGIRSFLNTPRRWPFHARQVRDSERLCVWRRLVIAALCVCVLLCTYGNSVTVLIIRIQGF